jgi:hypothetical protein
LIGLADLDKATLISVLADVFEGYDQHRTFELAGLVLRALPRGRGLPLPRGRSATPSPTT